MANNLGRFAMKWQGVYSAATSYVPFDLVYINGSTYLCIAAALNKDPETETAFWTISASVGDSAYQHAVDGGYAGTLNDFETALASIESKMDLVDATALKADAMASGSPKGQYATTVALEAALPTGDTGAYLVEADSHLYFWDSVTSACVDGGEYNVAHANKVTLTDTDGYFATKEAESAFQQIGKQIVLQPSGDETGATDYAKAIKMLADTNTILFGTGTFYFDTKITLGHGSVVIGNGRYNTLLNFLNSGAAFEYKTTIYNEAPAAPCFYRFKLRCKTGVILNDVARDVLDEDSASAQSYMMRPVFEDLSLESYAYDYSGYGIQMTKTFDASITRCGINGFATGIYELGCDFTNISNCRMMQNAVHIETYWNSLTFGSQVVIEHCDLLAPNTMFIKTSNRSPRIRNNYFEDVAGNCDYAIELGYAFNAVITENRFDLAKTGSYQTRITNDNTLQYLEYTKNNTRGSRKYPVVKFDNEFQYFGKEYYRYHQLIVHYGNTTEKGFPYEQHEKNGSYAYQFNPFGDGVAEKGYGDDYPKIADDSFVLRYTGDTDPALLLNRGVDEHNLTVMASTLFIVGTAYTLGDYVTPITMNGCIYKCTTAGTSDSSEPIWPVGFGETVTTGDAVFQNVGNVLSGAFDIYVVARATTVDDHITTNIKDPSTTVSTVETKITSTQWDKYLVASNVTASNLTLFMVNIKATNSHDDIYVKEVIVEYYDPGTDLTATVTIDPESLADGVGQTHGTVYVSGAAFGDVVLVTAPYDLQGVMCHGYVSSANNVKFRLQNETGGTVNLASGTWSIRVIKA